MEMLGGDANASLTYGDSSADNCTHYIDRFADYHPPKGKGPQAFAAQEVPKVKHTGERKLSTLTILYGKGAMNDNGNRNVYYFIGCACFIDLCVNCGVEKQTMNPLEHIMGTEEAAERWGLTQQYIKNLCREGRVKAVQIGKTWILDKDQPNPAQPTHPNNWRSKK